jgi:rare lipoprotein A (peptidoglycan hydrolase)
MLAAPALATSAITSDAMADPLREPAARPAATRHAPVRHIAARKRPTRQTIAPAYTQTIAHPTAWSQSGTASWYGGARWQGKVTAAGDRYDEKGLTAAHATLPIGSKVRVVVADTGRSVIVTINDRPGTRKRVIDLSRGAAEALGILHRGVAKVTLLPV